MEAKDLLEELIDGEYVFSMKNLYEMYIMQKQLEQVEDFFSKQFNILFGEDRFGREFSEEEKETYNTIIESEITFEPFRITYDEFMKNTNAELSTEDKDCFKKLFSEK